MCMGLQGRRPIISLYWTYLKLHPSYKVLKAYGSRLCARVLCMIVLTPKLRSSWRFGFFLKIDFCYYEFISCRKTNKNTSFPTLKRRKPRSGGAGG